MSKVASWLLFLPPTLALALGGFLAYHSVTGDWVRSADTPVSERVPVRFGDNLAIGNSGYLLGINITPEADGTIERVVENVAPGDVVSMPLQLQNNSNMTLRDIRMRTQMMSRNTLARSLQLDVYSCAAPWTSTEGRYRCGLGQTQVIPSQPLLGSNISLSSQQMLKQRAQLHVLVQFRVPVTVGNEAAGQTARFRLRFDTRLDR